MLSWVWGWLCVAQATEVVVATLNVGHGRGGQTHQITQSKERILTNLDAVAMALNTVQPDVVAFQEVDELAWWSGHVGQTDYLSEHLTMRKSVKGIHAKRRKLQYGTSLLTRYPLQNVESRVVRSSFPLPPKGFVLGTVNIEGTAVRVASIHLDPLRAPVRQKQMLTLKNDLADWHGPLIIMGDLNIEMGTELSSYCALLNVSTDLSGASEHTYPKLNRRLDWILVSSHFEMVEQTVYAERVSDHLLLSARLRLRDSVDSP